MSNDIPLRAIEKACALLNAETGKPNYYRSADFGLNAPIRVIAKLIAEAQAADEEEALKALAREIVAEASDKADSPKTAQGYRDGKWEEDFESPFSNLSLTLAGIKAGIKHEQEHGE